MLAHSHGDSMYWTAGVSLITLAVVYGVIWALGKKFKQNIPLALNLFVASGASALVVGFNPFRHLFEGPVWYISINLVILTGMIFLTCLKAAGNLDCIAYDILTHFRTRPSIVLVLGAGHRGGRHRWSTFPRGNTAAFVVTGKPAASRAPDRQDTGDSTFTGVTV